MNKIWSISVIFLFLFSLLLNTAPIIATAPEPEPPSGITVECHNTTRNATGLERYRHTIIVAQLTGTTDLGGWIVYLNITGAVTIHSTSTTNSVGICMWEWIPENLSTVVITAEYNGTITTNITRVIFPETDVILELEHSQKYGLNNRLYMQLFAVSKIGYFEPSGAPYRITITRHNNITNHTSLVEWVGFLDNHGFGAFYTDLVDTTYTTIDYEIWVYIYNNTGNATGEGDILIDSDGGTTNQRAEVYEPGYYLSFYDVYGPSTSLWWYNDTDDDNYYDIESETIEGLLWSHTVYGDIILVGWMPQEGAKQLCTANNYKNIYFNDTNEDEQWTNDTGSGLSEDIYLDNGNGVWDGNESQEGYPYKGYNGTPFLRMYHTIKVLPSVSAQETSITANKWAWLGYLNGSSKTGAQLYSEITNCTCIVMQNPATGYYYTYGYGLVEDFTITYGSAVCILCSSDETWNHG